MVLKIIKYPNPILKKKSEEVKEITPGIKELVLNIMAIMEEKKGIGLAAPQVGELKRIIIVQTTGSEKFTTGKGAEAFINPKILKKSKETEVMEEGCLSFPELFLEIKRAKTIEIEATNLEGTKIQFKADGIGARAFQHEIDHLDGILFIDKVGFWQKLKIKKTLKKSKF